MGRELLDKKELIYYLNGKLTYDTLGRLIRTNSIPVCKFPGIRKYLFDKSQIDLWLDNLQAQSLQQEPGKIRAVR